MQKLRRQLTTIAARILQRTEDAEDVAQEAIARLLAVREGGVRVESEAAFARRTTVNLAIDVIRRRNGHAAHLKRIEASRREEVTDRATPEDVTRLYDAIAALPPKQAAVITLRKLMELDYDDVAWLMGISKENCRSHCRHGLRKLRQALVEEQ